MIKQTQQPPMNNRLEGLDLARWFNRGPIEAMMRRLAG